METQLSSSFFRLVISPKVDGLGIIQLACLKSVEHLKGIKNVKSLRKFLRPREFHPEKKSE